MKKKFATYAMIGAIGASLLGGTALASAHGMEFGDSIFTAEQIAAKKETQFQKQAALIGVSVAEIKEAWANGKSISEIALSKGITKEQLQAKKKAAHEAEMKAHLQALVEKGVITQAQADTRLATMQKRTDAPKKLKRLGGMIKGNISVAQ